MLETLFHAELNGPCSNCTLLYYLLGIIVKLNTFNFNRHRNATKLMYYLSGYLALQFEIYLQCIIEITTEQWFRCMKYSDANCDFPKMYHYVRFLQIRSHIMARVWKTNCNFTFSISRNSNFKSLIT